MRKALEPKIQGDTLRLKPQGVKKKEPPIATPNGTLQCFVGARLQPRRLMLLVISALAAEVSPA
jgi:hypothetical protein